MFVYLRERLMGEEESKTKGSTIGETAE